jgi:hypothetical protein
MNLHPDIAANLARASHEERLREASTARLTNPTATFANQRRWLTAATTTAILGALGPFVAFAGTRPG